MVEGKSERRSHNRIVKNAGLGAKQLDLHPSFTTFLLRLSLQICKKRVILILISWGCCAI